MDVRSHWEQVHATKDPEQVSWFRPHLERSLELIERAAPDWLASIVDVGAGQFSGYWTGRGPQDIESSPVCAQDAR